MMSIRKSSITALAVLSLCVTAGLTVPQTGFAKVKKEALEKRRRFNSLVSEGMACFNRKDFSSAIPKFKQATELEPLDASVQYYLGLTCVHAGDFKQAEDALIKVVLVSNESSTFRKNALKFFDSYRKEFSRVRPYCCLNINGKFFHWAERSMPVKVYISDGLELPRAYQGERLKPDRIVELAKLLRNRNIAGTLFKQKHYQDGFNVSVRKGLDEWAWADTEGFLKYKLVKDPARADILVYWCSKFKGQELASTVYSTGPGEPIFIQIAVDTLLQQPLQKWQAIVQAVGAHELGHAFGLQNSDSPIDIMYPVERLKYSHTGHKQVLPNSVTNSDSAVLRALYSLPAPILK